MGTATWYTLDRALRVREHHAVGLEEALRLLRRHVRNARPSYETAEEALAATTFGFSRSDGEFVEICVHSPVAISLKVELPKPGVPRLLRPWLGVFQHEETLPSVEAASERVRQFFTLPVDQLRDLLRTSPVEPGQA